MREIPEPDWKILRQLHAVALDRFCRRVLEEVGRITADEKRSTHERYLDLFDYINNQNEDMAATFDDPRPTGRTLTVVG